MSKRIVFWAGNHPPLTPPIKGGGSGNPLPWRDREREGRYAVIRNPSPNNPSLSEFE